MEFHHRLSPLQGWTNSCEQDFCQGAKVLNSEHHGFSTPNSSAFSDYHDDWSDISDTIGCDVLEAFTDVILPENNDFGPEDLFQDIEYHDPNLPSYPQILWVPQPMEDHKKITLKLKKVKFSQYKSSSPCLSPSFEVVSPVSESECKDELVTEIFEISDGLPVQTSIDSTDSLTLKDAINLGNADMILDTYLSSDGCPSPDAFQDHRTLAAEADSISYGLSETLSPASDVSSVPSYYSEDQFSSVSSVFSSTCKITGRSSRKAKNKLSPESRYYRKKEQNKQAALRYRAKKKLEDEQLINALKEEENVRGQLEKKREDLKQEIRIMKKLMRETFIAKGLVPAEAFS